VAGDWTGSGRDSIGMYNPATCMWFLRNSLTTGTADITFRFMPGAGSLPVVGDWTAEFQLAQSVVVPAPGVTNLQSSVLPSMVQAAIARYVSAGLPADIAARMEQVQVVVTNLPGAVLGEEIGNTIYLNSNAAGHGWFIDPTPATDEAFTQLGSTGELQAVDPQAVDRIDLLTVVEHELGHVAGLGDLSPSATSLMGEVLPTGVRRLPGPAEIDAILAEPGTQ
jgi:hypothetical protein